MVARLHPSQQPPRRPGVVSDWLATCQLQLNRPIVWLCCRRCWCCCYCSCCLHPRLTALCVANLQMGTKIKSVLFLKIFWYYKVFKFHDRMLQNISLLHNILHEQLADCPSGQHKYITNSFHKSSDWGWRFPNLCHVSQKEMCSTMLLTPVLRMEVLSSVYSLHHKVQYITNCLKELKGVK